MKKHLGFTLIELLIVVAIIAILAAIAVPNFLEAQVRSKVSRAYADMRSIANAVESYVVDNNRYPPGYTTVREGGKVSVQPWASLAPKDRNRYAMSLMTTPIAYLTSIFMDPFTVGAVFARDEQFDPQPMPYFYDDYQPYDCFSSLGFESYCYERFVRINRKGYRWALSSAGPQSKSTMMWYALDGEDAAVAAANLEVVFPYDPSNGTKSEGMVARTNKGVFKEVNTR